MVETPADFDNELHLGVGAGSGAGLPWAGAEPGTHPKEAMALVPSSIINSKFTVLELTCTDLGL